MGAEAGVEQEDHSFSGPQTLWRKQCSPGTHLVGVGAGPRVAHIPPLGPPGSQGPRGLCLQARPLLRAPPARPPPCSSGPVSPVLSRQEEPTLLLPRL